MSVTLTNANLTSAAVGSTGSIDLSTISGGGGIPYQDNNKATIRLHNDSGAGLRITLPKSSQQFNLPAGGWADCYPAQGETQIVYLVLYLLPDPPVSLLMGTYYFPGEPVPPMTQLGNSPVGIGGTVQTSSVNTLSNEGNPANTLVIDIGDASLSQLLRIYASGQTIWKVDQSGVAHQVLNIQISGNPLQLGQAGDIVEILGKATVDQLLTAGAGITVSTSGITISAGGLAVTGGTTTDSLSVTGTSSLDNGAITTDGGGGVTFPNNKFLSWKDSGGATHTVIGFTSGNDPVIRTASNNARLLVEDGSGNVIAAFSNNQNGTDTIAEGAIECQKIFFNVGAIKDLNNGSNLSGTINHGLSGTPAAVLATCNSSSSSATVGASNYTSTQFTLTIGGGLNGRWLAYR